MTETPREGELFPVTTVVSHATSFGGTFVHLLAESARETARQRSRVSTRQTLRMYEDTTGWCAIPDLITPPEASRLADECMAILAELGADARTGDKTVQGTLHLVDLVERLPAVAALVGDEQLTGAVAQILGPRAALGETSFRCPRPGYGAQKLHADWLPQATVEPAVVATAIVALCDFTPDNGATRIVPGSHRRPDQQRRSGKLDDHPDEIVLTGRAGTAFVFSGHLLHSGTVNRSRQARPALQLVWRANDRAPG